MTQEEILDYFYDQIPYKRARTVAREVRPRAHDAA